MIGSLTAFVAANLLTALAPSLIVLFTARALAAATVADYTAAVAASHGFAQPRPPIEGAPD